MQSFSKQAPALTNPRCCGISCRVWLTESVSGCDHRAQLLETHFWSSGADFLSYEIIYKLPPLFVPKGFVFGHVDSVRVKFSITRPRTSLGNRHGDGLPQVTSICFSTV